MKLARIYDRGNKIIYEKNLSSQPSYTLYSFEVCISNYIMCWKCNSANITVLEIEVQLKPGFSNTGLF